MYQSPDKEQWKGRNDPGQTAEDHLWHHVVRQLELNQKVNKVQEDAVAFLGFASDEGVRRNKGRVGASAGPDALRKAMCNFAVHFDPEQFSIYDAGNVITSQNHLEEAQRELAGKVKMLLDHGYFPVLLGGGHEIAYGHYCGIHGHLQGEKTIGIINFDAHFDLRKYDQGAHSGSPFRQIADDCKSRGEEFHYLPIGISRASNTASLFQVMEQLGQRYILAEEANTLDTHQKIKAFADRVDHLYLSIDLDVISSGFVSGVSAPAPFGLTPREVRELLHQVLQTGKVISIDIAELNPTFDDGRSAKIAASFIYEVVMGGISH